MRRWPLCILGVFFAFASVASACGDDDDGGDSAEGTAAEAEGDTTTEDAPDETTDDILVEGPVTIVNRVDFEFRPVVGTFEVTEGADIAGCSTGSFVDSGSPTEGVQRVYTCEAGSNEGSFTASLSFLAEANTVSDSGTWTIVEGSDAFVDLQGDGDFSVVYEIDGPNIGEDTWTGEVNYTS